MSSQPLNQAKPTQLQRSLQENTFNLNYIPSLDGVRCFAVMAVILFHTRVYFIPGGFLGVDIFFTLSGFLITALLLREYTNKGRISLKAFYMRRIKRLIPALVLLMCVYILYGFIFRGIEAGISNCIDSLIALFYTSNWFAVMDSARPHWLGHTWSLSIEEQFYILWPALLVFLLRVLPNRLSLVLVPLGISACSVLLRFCYMAQGSSYVRSYYGLDTRFDALMIGCCLAMFFSLSHLWQKKSFKIISRAVSTLSVILLTYMIFFATHQSDVVIQWGLLAVALATAGLIMELVSAEGGWIKRTLEFPPFVYIGKISYGCYLWHYPIHRFLWDSGYTDKQCLIATVILTPIIASLSYYLLELPIRKK